MTPKAISDVNRSERIGRDALVEELEATRRARDYWMEAASMTRYPDSACEAHTNVTTSEPVCLICMQNELARLRVDAERYQALRTCPQDARIWPMVFMADDTAEPTTGDPLFGEKLDRAADAALAATAQAPVASPESEAPAPKQVADSSGRAEEEK